MSTRAARWVEALAAAHGPRTALVDDRAEVSFEELGAATASLADELRRREVRCLGLLAENGVPWVELDLAAGAAGVPIVPLPGFFTDAQLRGAIDRAGVDVIATDDPERSRALADGLAADGELGGLATLRRDASIALPVGAAKVTFTSGSTGHPKGVVLDLDVQLDVAAVTAEVTGCTAAERHLCLHPLSILLENVAGVYRVLAAGGTVLLPSERGRGVSGSCALNPSAVLAALRRAEATSAILVPAFLAELVARIERRPEERPTTLRFVGVGGARVSGLLLARALRLGIPVVQGYGLSEAGFVCTLNRADDRTPGSVGAPLPGVEVRIAPDGEVLLRGRRCLGYLDAPAPTNDDGFWPTGDLGRLDEDGRLYLEGRKRDVICTSHGRNVAPAWIEEVLTEEPPLSAARVFEGGAGTLIAVVRCSRGPEAAAEAVRRVNRSLPDYARIRHWRLEGEPRVASGRSPEGSRCSTID